MWVTFVCWLILGKNNPFSKIATLILSSLWPHSSCQESHFFVQVIFLLHPTHSFRQTFIWAFLHVTWLPLCLFTLDLLSINCLWCSFEEVLLLWLFAFFIDITTFVANCQFIFSYLKRDLRMSHHSSEPAQSTIYEPQDGKEGYNICCNVSDKSYWGRCSAASSLQNVLFIPRSVYTHKVSMFRIIIYERQMRTDRGRCTHPAETFTLFSDLKGLSSVSG